MVKRKRFARYKDPSTHSSVRSYRNNSRVESIQIIEYYRSKANNIGGYGRSIGSILVGRETIQLPETGKRTTPRHATRFAIVSSEWRSSFEQNRWINRSLLLFIRARAVLYRASMTWSCYTISRDRILRSVRCSSFGTRPWSSPLRTVIREQSRPEFTVDLDHDKTAVNLFPDGSRSLKCPLRAGPVKEDGADSRSLLFTEKSISARPRDA